MNKPICFMLGAAAGIGATCYFWKEYYRKRADEEIRSVVEEFSKTKKDNTEESKPNPEPQPSTDVIESWKAEHKSKLQDYTAMIRNNGYHNLGSPKDQISDDPDEPPPGDNITKPYSISPEDFDTLDGYDVITFMYYSDGVLTDDNDEPLTKEEIAWSVGFDFASHFGEYEDDSVHIRNDMRQVDYEILKDNRKFEDLYGPK